MSDSIEAAAKGCAGAVVFLSPSGQPYRSRTRSFEVWGQDPSKRVHFGLMWD